MSLLELQHVTKKFGGLTAVDDLSLAVEPGQIKALIGPNGAGKTTVFNLITGVYKVTSGNIIFDGKNINGMGPDKIVSIGICRTFQNIRLFKKMKAIDNVMTGMHCRTHNDVFSSFLNPFRTNAEEKMIREKSLEHMDFLGIVDMKDELAQNLPYGHQRLLEIARALASEPKLLFLDEPAAGMNKEEKARLIDMIRKIRDHYQVSILLVEHDMGIIMDISESIAVINYGRKIAEGLPSDIQNNEEVIEAYLGRGDDTL